MKDVVRNVMDNDKLMSIHPKFEQIAKQEGFYSKELMEKGYISMI